MFVSIEGIEASGKSTVTELVAGRLRQDQLSVDFLREFASPSSRAPVVQATRETMFFSLGFEEGPRAALLYMLYHEAVKWELAAASSRDVMLADRFLDTVVAYQGHFLPGNRSVDTTIALAELIESLLRQVGVPIPDVTYLLDVPPELSAQRFANREGRRFTQFEFDQITQISASLRALGSSNARIMLIDASHPLERVVDLIYEDLCTRLSARIRQGNE